jgi:histidine ammonia-lyase
MGGFAERKAFIVVERMETVVALEILAACPCPATGAPPRVLARLAERHIGQRRAQEPQQVGQRRT